MNSSKSESSLSKGKSYKLSFSNILMYCSVFLSESHSFAYGQVGLTDKSNSWSFLVSPPDIMARWAPDFCDYFFTESIICDFTEFIIKMLFGWKKSPSLFMPNFNQPVENNVLAHPIFSVCPDDHVWGKIALEQPHSFKNKQWF